VCCSKTRQCRRVVLGEALKPAGTGCHQSPNRRLGVYHSSSKKQSSTTTTPAPPSVVRFVAGDKTSSADDVIDGLEFSLTDEALFDYHHSLGLSAANGGCSFS